MTSARRTLLLLNLALLACWVVWAVVVYDRLPASIPTHFGPSGIADRYSARSYASWLALPAIGTGTMVLILGLAQMTQRRPDLYNIPGKATLLALHASQQRPFLEQIALVMTLLATSVLVLFIAIHVDSWRVATAGQRGLSMVSWAAMAVSFVGATIAMPLWMLRMGRRLAALQHEHARTRR